MNYRETSRLANRARTAISANDWEILRYSGNRFERACYYREAWKVLAACVEGQAAVGRPIWTGPFRPTSDCWSFLVPETLAMSCG